MPSEKHLLYYGDRETADLADMHEKFWNDHSLTPRMLARSVARARAAFLQEELDEFKAAIEANDFLGQIDALIDLVVVAKGTACRMGLCWDLHWNEVHKANMAKEVGRNPKRPELEHDLIKPSGWEGPDHRRILLSYRR